MLNQNVINDLLWFFSLFKSSPLVIIGGMFTIYFGIQKLTKKVGISYSMSTSRLYKQHIPAVVLSNKRDNAIAIDSLFIRVNFKYRIRLKVFDSPLVLKAYDTLKIDLPKYSEIRHNTGNFEFGFFDKLNFYLRTTAGEVIHCNIESSISPQIDAEKTSITTITYEGLVLTDRYAFIFTYYKDKTKKNLVIDTTGIFDGDNPFPYNFISIEDINNGMLKEILIKQGLHEYLDNYHLARVNPNLSTDTIFFKYQVERELKEKIENE